MFRKGSLIVQPHDRENQCCLSGDMVRRMEPLFLQVLSAKSTCKVGLRMRVEVVLLIFLVHPGHDWPTQGESQPPPAGSPPNLVSASPLLLRLSFVSPDLSLLSPLCLPAWHSDGLASLALNPPTLFRSLRLDSYILAQGLFLSALPVTKLFGTAPGPPPVIHSAQQTCKYSLSCWTL